MPSALVAATLGRIRMTDLVNGEMTVIHFQ